MVDDLTAASSLPARKLLDDCQPGRMPKCAENRREFLAACQTVL